MFIGTAHAAAPDAAAGPDLVSFLPMIVIFVLFYFMLVRPQQKKAKELQNMIAGLQKGDEVVTTGGALGKVSKLTEPAELDAKRAVIEAALARARARRRSE